MGEALDFLKSDLATVQFGFKGQLGEASKAVEPILLAFENADTALLPQRISKGFKKQVETEIDQLKAAGLKRVIRITSPKFISVQSKNSLGFTRLVDASREWRECEIVAAVLEQYIDIKTGECVIEKFDEKAMLTIRQSRHIRASDQSKAKKLKKDIYTREQYECPSCGAQLEHIADKTNCPFCGAYITFNFFDWQLDSFYLDLRKATLIDEAKEAAAKATIGFFSIASKVTDLLATSWDRRDAKKPNQAGYNNRLGAALTVIILIGLVIVYAISSIPWYIQLALGIVAAALVVFGIVKYLKATEQSRKKKQIVRYSDAYLRSCVYGEIWKDLETDSLIDFSIDDIILKSVNSTEKTTTVELTATVIKKYLTENRKIDIVTQDVTMTLSRARYPERKKNKGDILVEKDCPSCGANFEPDENHCCSYCGYGLKMENYVWRKAAQADSVR